MNHILRHDNGNVIGELEWDVRPGATYECHLDVVPGYQRKGVGRSMMEELESIVSTKKGMCIYTFMAADNVKAQRFFSAMGFRLVLASGFYGDGRDAYFGWKTVGQPK